MGNVDSVARAIEECGGTAKITDRREDLETAAYLILPGVGAFADGMRNLREKGFADVLTEQAIGKQIPFLGLCLGMQLMASKGIEGGDAKGLGWIEGDVLKLEPTQKGEKIPHIGWNEVRSTRPNPLFDGIEDGKDFYFVHSYRVNCKSKDDVLAKTPYCGDTAAALGRGNLFGVQFHPEKSQKPGLKLLKNFLAL
ncbi:MAG: imidazole glycerol phosphate synthase subunit HisH [Elusimicrobia bacterium]|nr:imidazole glycerol phosphate synthase subunit HisH [Elusimicrobiota bacterium]